MRVQTRGEFGGLGIEVTMEDELVKVISPIDDTPAAKAGVLAGDKIAKIDGENVRGLSLQDAVEKMRGPVNTPIVLTIMREGADKPLDITMVRDVIKVKAVKYRVEGDDVGYLKVTCFTEQTEDDLEAGIKKIQEQLGADKLKGYVLDLRLNPGGLLDQAVSVSDTFLDRGEIVSTRGRDRGRDPPLCRQGRRPHRWQAADRAGQWRFGQRLGNRCRRVAGPQARDVLGTRSFGKGSVQTIIPLGEQRRAAPDDGALLHAVGQFDPGQGHRRPTSASTSRCRPNCRASWNRAANLSCAAT